MLKRITLAATLLIAATTLMAKAPASYSGAWLLAKSESKNLPRNYDIVKSARVMVTQDEKTFTINVTIDAEGRPEYKQSFLYPLDGTSRTTESTIRTPNGPLQVPTTLAAQVKDGGVLELTETRIVSFDPSNKVTVTSTELWTLSDEGKTLTIHRKDQRPQGLQEYDMVFHRESISGQERQ